MKQFNFLCVALCFFCTLHGQSMYKLSTDFKYDSLKALDNEYFAVKENGLWGIIKGNEIVIPCKYEQIDNFGDNIVAFIQNGRVGFADINGNLIAEPQYLLEVNYNRSDKSPLNVFSNGSALVYNGEKFILLGKDGKSIVEDNIEILSKVGNTAIYRTNGAYGLMDALGNPLTEAKYLQIQPVIEDRLYAYIGVRDGLRVWGFLNSKGEMKSHAYFDDVQLISKGDKFYIKAYLPTGKQALFDENGEILFQPLYQVIEPTLYPSYFNITEDGKRGIIGADYVLYVPTAYDQVQIANVGTDTFFVAMNEGVSFILNKKNQLIAHYEGNISGFISYSDDNVIFVADSFLSYGVMSSRDGWLIPPKYYEALGMVEDNIILRNGKKWGAMNLKGEITVPFEYEKVKISDKRTYVVFYAGKNNSILLNDKAEKISFPKVKKLFAFDKYIEYTYKKETTRLYAEGKELRTKFLDIGTEKDGILTVKDKEGWTYIDAKTQKPLTDKHYDRVSNFVNGQALVIKNKQMLVIDKNFNEIHTLIKDKKTSMDMAMLMLNMAVARDKSYVILRMDGKYGVITINNKQ